jgi:lipopolysaccharide export system protein LptA
MVHYTGAVEVLQKNDRLRSDSLKVFTKQLGPSRSSDSGPNCGDTDHIDADGGVYYVTPKEIVKADHAVYNADAKTVVFTGQVIVAQGKNVMAGTRFLIHTDTHDAQMESDVTGRGNPGRVRSIIYPKSASGAPGTATSPPGSPSPPTPPPPRQHGAG